MLEILPDVEKTWFFLGIAYEKTGQYEKAIEAYQEYVELNRADAEVLNSLGIAYTKAGKITEAIKVFAEVLWDEPYRPELWTNLANAYEV